MNSDDKLRHILIQIKTLIFKCRELAKRYNEIIKYVIFGVLTTVVDYAVYFIGNEILGINETLANAISWLAAVLFAFVTNKVYVFKSQRKKLSSVLCEFGTFFAARSVTGFVYIGGFPLLTEILEINGYITKAILSVFNIVVNYVFSKLVTFKNRNEDIAENDENDKITSPSAPRVRNGAVMIGNFMGDDTELSDDSDENFNEEGVDENEA